MKKIESLYLHFPFCTHLCNYCDFYKKVSTNKKQDYDAFHLYLQTAFNEHEKLMKTHGYSWAPLKTLYIGGGTPSLWGKEGKEFLQNFLSVNNISLSEKCEFTLEVNPGAWDENILNEWESIGVNRYSLGIQSLDGTLSKYLDRAHSIDEVFQTLEFFYKRRANFSVDFMLGLPFSVEENRDVISELKRALEYSPTHFSVYILTVKDNYKHFNQLPNEEWIEKEYLEVSRHLKDLGFKHYEVSSFGLMGKESQHNLRYWNSFTVGALGPSATGFLAETKLRYKWKANSPEMEIEQLTNEEYELERIYMALRSSIGLDLKTYGTDDLKKCVAKWLERGWAILDEREHLSLTSQGYLLLDSLMSDLFNSKFIK
jgi:oxygen-independent coproporphyrinogen-3 oxidase